MPYLRSVHKDIEGATNSRCEVERCSHYQVLSPETVVASPSQRCHCDHNHSTKISSYIAEYPSLRTAQSTLHFTSWKSVKSSTISASLGKHPGMLQLMHKEYWYTNIHLSVARYSFKQQRFSLCVSSISSVSLSLTL